MRVKSGAEINGNFVKVGIKADEYEEEAVWIVKKRNRYNLYNRFFTFKYLINIKYNFLNNYIYSI